MPLVKSNEPLGQSPAIILLFGDPGVRKTSIGHTFEKPILIDFDRGVKRSFGRRDVLAVEDWDEVLREDRAGLFKQFKTVVIDTAKACLDDFLMVYVVNQDYKLATNKLKAYGAIGDAFKLFVNNLRANGTDLVIIAHSKKDDDKHVVPDVTGQSSQLLLRIADQVGYVRMENNVPVISFNPTDLITGKNCAGLGTLTVPDKSDPAFRTFGAKLMNDVKEAIAGTNEEQRAALAAAEQYQNQLAAIATPDDLTSLLGAVQDLPDYLKLPLQKEIGALAKTKGWVANKETKRFEAPEKAPIASAAPAQEKAAPVKKEEPAAPSSAPAVAEKQTLGWFEERVGKFVWSQGDEGNTDHFTGPYEIEGSTWPEYMLTLQDQGYTFRDLTPAEAALPKKEETAA